MECDDQVNNVTADPKWHLHLRLTQVLPKKTGLQLKKILNIGPATDARPSPSVHFRAESSQHFL